MSCGVWARSYDVCGDLAGVHSAALRLSSASLSHHRHRALCDLGEREVSWGKQCIPDTSFAGSRITWCHSTQPCKSMLRCIVICPVTLSLFWNSTLDLEARSPADRRVWLTFFCFCYTHTISLGPHVMALLVLQGCQLMTVLSMCRRYGPIHRRGCEPGKPVAVGAHDGRGGALQRRARGQQDC